MYQYLKQRKSSPRMQHWNYSQCGFYFITICVKNMACVFGDVMDDEMLLNDYGEIVKQQLLWLEKRYPYVELDQYIIMPNHVHVIVNITDVGTGRDLSLPKSLSLPKPYKIKSIPELIGAFKTTSSKKIHQRGLTNFQWQRSYYDHIIRNNHELFQIQKYIKNNPQNWSMDQNHPKNK